MFLDSITLESFPLCHFEKLSPLFNMGHSLEGPCSFDLIRHTPPHHLSPAALLCVLICQPYNKARSFLSRSAFRIRSNRHQHKTTSNKLLCQNCWCRSTDTHCTNKVEKHVLQYQLIHFASIFSVICCTNNTCCLFLANPSDVEVWRMPRAF